MVRSGIVATCALCLWVSSASHGLGVADRFGQLLGAAAGTTSIKPAPLKPIESTRPVSVPEAEFDVLWDRTELYANFDKSYFSRFATNPQGRCERSNAEKYYGFDFDGNDAPDEYHLYGCYFFLEVEDIQFSDGSLYEYPGLNFVEPMVKLICNGPRGRADCTKTYTGHEVLNLSGAKPGWWAGRGVLVEDLNGDGQLDFALAQNNDLANTFESSFLAPGEHERIEAAARATWGDQVFDDYLAYRASIGEYSGGQDVLNFWFPASQTVALSAPGGHQVKSLPLPHGGPGNPGMTFGDALRLKTVYVPEKQMYLNLIAGNDGSFWYLIDEENNPVLVATEYSSRKTIPELADQGALPFDPYQFAEFPSRLVADIDPIITVGDSRFGIASNFLGYGGELSLECYEAYIESGSCMREGFDIVMETATGEVKTVASWDLSASFELDTTLLTNPGDARNQDGGLCLFAHKEAVPRQCLAVKYQDRWHYMSEPVGANTYARFFQKTAESDGEWFVAVTLRSWGPWVNADNAEKLDEIHPIGWCYGLERTAVASQSCQAGTFRQLVLEFKFDPVSYQLDLLGPLFDMPHSEFFNASEMRVEDINGDGLNDFLIGPSPGQTQQIYLAQPGGGARRLAVHNLGCAEQDGPCGGLPQVPQGYDIGPFSFRDHNRDGFIDYEIEPVLISNRAISRLQVSYAKASLSDYLPVLDAAEHYRRMAACFQDAIDADREVNGCHTYF